jgi:hypothetical protein
VINSQLKVNKKEKKKEYFKAINASLIIQNSGSSDSRFMGNMNEYLPNPNDHISLEPGVVLESKGKSISGPEVDRQNRMTLEEYFLM